VRSMICVRRDVLREGNVPRFIHRTEVAEDALLSDHNQASPGLPELIQQVYERLRRVAGLHIASFCWHRRTFVVRSSSPTCTMTDISCSMLVW
jgi:hypothetical protein